VDDTTQFILTAVFGGGALGAVIVAALETRLRRVFTTREDADGMARRLDARLDRKAQLIERNVGLYVALDDRVGDLEQETTRLGERQTQQWERISEQMATTARTIERTAHEIQEVAKIQHALALELERRHQPRGKP
jgi:hypothetical protein